MSKASANRDLYETQKGHGVKVPVFTVATAPSATESAGLVALFSDGAAGSAILAFSDGTDWKRSDTGATVADS